MEAYTLCVGKVSGNCSQVQQACVTSQDAWFGQCVWAYALQQCPNFTAASVPYRRVQRRWPRLSYHQDPLNSQKLQTVRFGWLKHRLFQRHGGEALPAETGDAPTNQNSVRVP
jgi:hypothetical protein